MIKVKIDKSNIFFITKYSKNHKITLSRFKKLMDFRKKYLKYPADQSNTSL